MRSILWSFLFFLSFGLIAIAQGAQCPEFPDADWPMGEADLKSADFRDFEAYVFRKRAEPGSVRSGIRTDGILVIKNGCTIYERYDAGFTAARKHLIWSITKSITNVVIGAAETQGILLRADLVSKYFPDFEGPYRDRLKIQDLLQWSSGFEWDEGYEYDPLRSDVITMLYTDGRSDMSRYVLGRPAVKAPGERYLYSTGDSTLLMGILRKALKGKDDGDFAWNHVFRKIGMSQAIWERDHAGTFVGGAFFYTTPRDLARIGYLMLKNGRWKKEQVLPKDWLEFSTKLAPSFHGSQSLKENENVRSHPGAHWWSNQSDAKQGIKSAWPDAPEDTFAAFGHWGQSLFVIPSKNLLVVRFGDDRDDSFHKNEYLKRVIKAFGS